MPTLEEKQAAMRAKMSSVRTEPRVIQSLPIKPVIARKSLAESQAEYYAKLKAKVIEAYGGRCQCPDGCDIRLPAFLTIDHSQNDGKADRKAIGHSTRLLRWLVKNGFPKDRYRLLCYNCNMARAHRKAKGYTCPHEDKRVRIKPLR